MKVNFHQEVENSLCKFCVIVTRYNNKWVFCKKKNFDTWEIPGGTREEGESLLECAKREL